MKKFLYVLVAVVCLAPFSRAQAPDIRVVFAPLTAVSNTPAAGLVRTPNSTSGTPTFTTSFFPKYHTVQASVTGSPTGCGYHVWGTTLLPSENPSYPGDYQDLSGLLDCTTAAGSMVHIYYKPIAGIVIALSALSGGTTPGVTFRFIAAQ